MSKSIIYNSITLTYDIFTSEFFDTEIKTATIMKLNGDTQTNIISEDITYYDVRILNIKESELTALKLFLNWAIKGQEFVIDSVTYKFKPNSGTKYSDFLTKLNKDRYNLKIPAIEA